MAAASHDFSKHKKSYAAVGIALLVFTCVTVAIGLMPVFDFGPPGPTPSDFVIGLNSKGSSYTHRCSNRLPRYFVRIRVCSNGNPGLYRQRSG